MATINLYRIEDEKRESFITDLSEKIPWVEQKNIEYVFPDNHVETFIVQFYLDESYQKQTKTVPWNWAIKAFDRQDILMHKQPKAVMTITKADKTLYAITFGHAYYLVDKYCEKEFGLSFARKMEYSEIKTTTLSSPSSIRNKSIYSYIDQTNLEFGSGESYAKLKAKVILPEDFQLYKPLIEAGTSLKIKVNGESLESIISTILDIELRLMQQDLCKIPLFVKVKNKDLIEQLDKGLYENIGKDSGNINFYEIEIIGTTETFNNNDDEFMLSYCGKEQKIEFLNNDTVEEFCKRNGFDFSTVALDINVSIFRNGIIADERKIRELIDYTDEKEKCLLFKGDWYHYNDDYLEYLRLSISEIEACYNPMYDFNKQIYDEFIYEKYLLEKDEEKYQGLSEEEIYTKLEKKYYAERAYNILRSEKDGFENHDRNDFFIEGHPIELMDLYKEGATCAVKIGNSSGKLCYAFDQSLAGLKVYKNFPELPIVDKAIVWLVLERKNHIEDEKGVPDLNKLDMLVLKNRLDSWKKEVRLMGIKPMIYVNYRQ